ncbi:hypothetical protein B9G55_11335 [Saccharibacillus sp. O16]|nr:hypothetical protein B9G55_11335 [Saccharibacillus sp. O16]
MHTVPQAEQQLDILRELGTVFQAIDEPFWLRGGWAIDFRVGRVLREHEDLDLVALSSARQPLAEKLEAAGFESVLINDKQTDYRKNGVDVQILYLAYDEAGTLTPLNIPEWIWMPDCLDPQIRELGGVCARSLTYRQLLAEKLDYESIGRPKREKDTASKELLRRLMAEEQ